MEQHISIDDDNDFANDLTASRRRYRCPRREAAALIKEDLQHHFQYANADDERSLRRLRRRHSTRFNLQQTPPPPARSHSKKLRAHTDVDPNYAFYLNFYASRDVRVAPRDAHCTDADADPQYDKGLSFLEPYKTSYVLHVLNGDGSSDLLTYECDDDMVSDQPKHTNRMGFKKSTYEPSEALGRSVAKDKMGAQNAGHPSLKESLMVGPEISSMVPPASADSQMRSFDINYQFYLAQNFNLKLGKKLSCPQDSKKRNACSVPENATKETSRKHTLRSNVHSGHMFDGSRRKKPRLSQPSGKGVNTTKDAQDANGDPKFRTTDHLKEGKHEGKTSNIRHSGHSRHKSFPDKAIRKDKGVQASNDKLRKRCRLAVDDENIVKKPVAPSAEQETNNTAVFLREKPDDKFRKNHRLSRSMEQATTTKKTLAGSVGKDATGLGAAHAIQSSGKKSHLKNHDQPGSEFKFDGQINDSYREFLSGLSDKTGHPVFQSGEGKVVTYEKDLKESSIDAESDSDSLIIIGDSINGITDPKYRSFLTGDSYFQELKLGKSQTNKFKKKLMDILMKPYDQEEYKSLMEEAKKRRPLEGYRDLRGGRSGTYELESLGKSYLDHHEDVAEAIKKCGGDRQRILTLLRGFMYWLEHIADVGAFKPWKDKRYLEVQPRTSTLRRSIKSEAH